MRGGQEMPMQVPLSILIASATQLDAGANYDREGLIATLQLAQLQIERGVAWSASEIIGEAIRELSGQPLQLQ